MIFVLVNHGLIPVGAAAVPVRSSHGVIGNKAMKLLTNVLLNRLVIALISAIGAFILAQWPAVHDEFCKVTGLF